MKRIVFSRYFLRYCHCFFVQAGSMKETYDIIIPRYRNIIAVTKFLSDITFFILIYDNLINLTIPISNPLNSARPLNLPMAEYPGLVFFFKSSSIWCPWSGRIGIFTFLILHQLAQLFLQLRTYPHPLLNDCLQKNHQTHFARVLRRCKKWILSPNFLIIPANHCLSLRQMNRCRNKCHYLTKELHQPVPVHRRLLIQFGAGLKYYRAGHQGEWPSLHRVHQLPG